MTKNEKQDLEVLKTSFEMNEWEGFILVLNEIRGRDKEIISMYRKSHIELKEIKKETWNKRYRSVLKSMEWINQDVADITGNSLNSVEVVTTKTDENFPRWAKAMIVLHEQMLLKGQITYDKPEVYRVETDKK